MNNIHEIRFIILVFGEAKVGMIGDVDVNFGDDWSLFSLIKQC